MSEYEDVYERTMKSLVASQLPNISAHQNRDSFRDTMRGFENQFLADPFAVNGPTQRRFNDTYLPHRNTLSENFLQQSFLQDANSFVQYQTIASGGNAAELEQLAAIRANLNPEHKIFVNPGTSAFAESTQQNLQRFRTPNQNELKATNDLLSNNQRRSSNNARAIFDNDSTLFNRNVLSLVENPTLPPSEMKSYIDILGGIEDTIATMESSLKQSELKNLEEKYVNFYVPQYQPPPPPAPVETPPPPINPFDRKPRDNNPYPLNASTAVFYPPSNVFPEQSTHGSHFQQPEVPKSRMNPILEQSKRLRAQREKQFAGIL